MPIDTVTLAAAILVLVVIGAVVGAFVAIARTENPIVRRLRTGPATVVVETHAADVLAQILDPLAKLAQPRNDEEASRSRLQLIRGGLRTDQAVRMFQASKVVLPGLFTLALFWIQALRSGSGQPPVALALVVFAAGYYAPDLWLRTRTQARMSTIERGLPDTLDLLITCVEAGLGLDAALQRVAAEMKLAWPVLGEELELTSLESKAGIARIDAFRRLAERTGVAALKSLAATLAQTEMFGTSVGAALRVQSEGIRMHRMQRAEEKAGYVSVKMALPMAFCIMPSLFIVILGPAVVRVYDTLMPTLARGGR